MRCAVLQQPGQPVPTLPTARTKDNRRFTESHPVSRYGVQEDLTPPGLFDLKLRIGSGLSFWDSENFTIAFPGEIQSWCG